MPKKLENVPDLTGFKNYFEYLSTNPTIKMGSSTFVRYRSKQLSYLIQAQTNQPLLTTKEISQQVQQERSINNIKKLEEIVEELNPDDKRIFLEKSDLPIPIKSFLTLIALKSLVKYIPTQWQAAARTLEAVKPQCFAKHDNSQMIADKIGIQITIGAKEHQNTIDISDNVKVETLNVK